MSQTPVTVTYSLEEILGQINGKLDNLQKDVSEFRTETRVSIEAVKGEIKALDTKLTGEIKTLDAKLTGEIKALDAELKGVSKRLDTQEFINRSVVVGFILALTAGGIKLFFPNFPH
ncbi:hypothetical protein [Crocosphaera sp. XPORK-15E]|uniref:hypothetical protein n=1 Tax=Crocosphaera sp. XPORK-15E TaxID=3110247 RepID=UPI002B1FCED8|nr:hypothetical protein [Crocosphaera sp. XPORK-15E]MEA5537287.1 hypothetical protein [Crocosphaera sp. XPORK-15E]